MGFGRRLGHLSLLFALLAVCVSFAGRPAPADAAGPTLTTGVSYIYANDPAAFEHTRQAGARFALTPLRWGAVTPNSPPAGWDPANPLDPNYEWEEIDTWVINAVRTGVTPVLQVRGAPLWAQRCPGSEDAPCDVDPAQLATFAYAAARRYSGVYPGLPKVSYWQGLNEPNLSLFFAPQYVGGKPVSAHLYRALINSFYDAIKAVDPGNLVIAAGLGPNAVPKYTIGPLQFTRELLCMRGRERFRPAPGNCGGALRFDIFDIHPYTTGGPTHEGGPNDVQLGDIGQLKALLEAADRAGRIEGRFRRTKLWITELAWDSRPPDPGGLPMRILNRWAAEAIFRSWRTGIDAFFWYSLRDSAQEPGVPSYETPQAGLFFRGPTVALDRPKGVFYAFRFPFVSYPRKNGLFFWGRTPASTRGRVVIQAWRGGKWRRVAVTRANRAGVFRGRTGNRYGRRLRGKVRAVYHGQATVPFSMRPVPDFRQPPFGAAPG